MTILADDVVRASEAFKAASGGRILVAVSVIRHGNEDRAEFAFKDGDRVRVVSARMWEVLGEYAGAVVARDMKARATL